MDVDVLISGGTHRCVDPVDAQEMVETRERLADDPGLGSRRLKKEDDSL